MEYGPAPAPTPASTPAITEAGGSRPPATAPWCINCEALESDSTFTLADSDGTVTPAGIFTLAEHTTGIAPPCLLGLHAHAVLRARSEGVGGVRVGAGPSLPPSKKAVVRLDGGSVGSSVDEGAAKAGATAWVRREGDGGLTYVSKDQTSAADGEGGRCCCCCHGWRGLWESYRGAAEWTGESVIRRVGQWGDPDPGPDPNPNSNPWLPGSTPLPCVRGRSPGRVTSRSVTRRAAGGEGCDRMCKGGGCRSEGGLPWGKPPPGGLAVPSPGPIGRRRAGGERLPPEGSCEWGGAKLARVHVKTGSGQGSGLPQPLDEGIVKGSGFALLPEEGLLRGS